MQNKIDTLYNDTIDTNNELDYSKNDKTINNYNPFLNQFEFKEPTLKRKRVDNTNNITNLKELKKTRLELKITSLELTKTKESMKLASADFHKSLNMAKDSLELEMLYEDPSEKKNVIKGKLEYDHKKRKFVQKEDKSWFKNEAGVKIKSGDKFGK